MRDDLREAIGRVAKFLEQYRGSANIGCCGNVNGRPDGPTPAGTFAHGADEERRGEFSRLRAKLKESLTMKPIQVGLLASAPSAAAFQRIATQPGRNQPPRGPGIEIAMVADLDVERAKSVVGSKVQVVNDARAVIANPDIDIVVELIGGYGVAKALVLEAIAAGKICGHRQQGLAGRAWHRNFQAASAKGVMVAFEAAVAGGIPIIKALREGLTANRIQWIAGIINGTTNFILSGDARQGPGL